MWIRRSKFVCVQRSLFVYRNTLHMYAFITIMILLGEQPTNQMLAFFFLLFFYLFCCFFFVRSNVVDNNKFVMRQFAIRKKVDSTIFCMELKYIYIWFTFLRLLIQNANRLAEKKITIFFCVTFTVNAFARTKEHFVNGSENRISNWKAQIEWTVFAGRMRSKIVFAKSRK